ncbi:MAG: TonB-dependent receptor [Candidatus Sulfopaludibacter sp.]|nr:TonB-dependent receptor [Candidatus Sulfopaludibacter sp.]
MQRFRISLLPACVLPLMAQLTTGAIQGTLRGTDNRPAPGVPILIAGAVGFHSVVHSNSQGEFAITLPYGRYQLSGTTVFVVPLQTTIVHLTVGPAGVIHAAPPTEIRPPGSVYPEGFSLQSLLLSREPSAVSEPLDFTGLADNRPAVVSQRGYSWTGTQFQLQGTDATDAWQPGLPLVLPDIQALDTVAVQDGTAGVFLLQPGPAWHVTLATANTGAALSSTNLPAPDSRGLVQQPDRFQWMTRDELQVGGPLTRWSDIFAAASGQWASQTEPLASPRTKQGSRLLFANARGRVRAGSHDQFDALYSGSRIDLSDGGVPAGLEALTGNRLAPSFVLPGGFSGDPETDHFDFVQVGWIHDNIEVRYGYSTAHLDTSTSPTGRTQIELVGGTVSGAPPLANLAVRPRHQFAGAWQPRVWRALRVRHQVTAGGTWEHSSIRNRFTTPSGLNFITADGAPAFITEFNTPLDSRELVQSSSASVEDRMSLASSLPLDVGLLADFSRGSLPAQADLIAWNSVSPHAGVAWRVPHSHGLTLRGSYHRLYAPLAGRYLDFGNPNSLGGSTFQWNGSSAPGALLLRFGGPYSSISPALRRPYSDEFDLGADFAVAPRSLLSIHLFRRDDKDRIAALDTGVPAQAFTPVSILDPGPDGIPGTFDDQRLTVYAQNPATLGQDRYLLSNPAGLRELNTGMVAEAGTAWRGLTLHASFLAEKSYGPTNPGDSAYENDPGVIGALFLDPNTAIHAAGRSFVDRAFAGKIQAHYQMPRAWGGIEVASVADYTDGLVFARQLLVTGLPQGPFLVAATVRGSPGGGNRAQYVLNWNLRVSRRFELPFGGITASADLLNVNNSAQRVQESDISGPTFNARLPVAIQPARFVRIGFRYEF